ncbi:hypothetical protein ACLOJK_034258 [Asimina triloba]
MGHDRSGIELKLLMTGEEDSPRVAAVINVGLRSQQIWNVRIVFFVMNGSDGPSGRSPVVGIDGRRRHLRGRRSTAMMHGGRRQRGGWLRAAAAGGTAGFERWQRRTVASPAVAAVAAMAATHLIGEPTTSYINGIMPKVTQHRSPSLKKNK